MGRHAHNAAEGCLRVTAFENPRGVHATPVRRRRDTSKTSARQRRDMVAEKGNAGVSCDARGTCTFKIYIPPHSGGIFSSEFTSFCLFSVFFEAPLLAQIF